MDKEKRDFSFESNWYSIRDKIFDGPTLEQDGVVEKFGELDKVIHRQIKLLVYNTDFVESYLVHFFRELSAGQLRNRVLFLTPKPEIKTKDPYRTDEVLQLECLAEIFAYKAHGNKDLFLKKLLAIPFIRLVYEEIVNGYLKYAKDYPEIARKMAEAHAVVYEGDLAATNEYEKYLLATRETEALLYTQHSAVSGVISQLKEYHLKYQTIRNDIAVPYFRIVYTVAKKNTTTQVQFFDNFQNGSVGLFMAISRYSPDKATFGAYATWWVRQQVLYNLKAEINLIRIPVSLWEAYGQLEKVKNASPEEVPIDELSVNTGFSEDKIQNIIEQVKSSQPYSLNHYLDAEYQEGELGDVLFDNEQEDRQHQLERDERILSWISGLEDDESQVYLLENGFLDWLPDKVVDRSEWDTLIASERKRQLVASAYLKAVRCLDV